MENKTSQEIILNIAQTELLTDDQMLAVEAGDCKSCTTSQKTVIKDSFNPTVEVPTGGSSSSSRNSSSLISYNNGYSAIVL